MGGGGDKKIMRDLLERVLNGDKKKRESQKKTKCERERKKRRRKKSVTKKEQDRLQDWNKELGPIL